MKTLIFFMWFACFSTFCDAITQELERSMAEAFYEAKCLKRFEHSECENFKCNSYNNILLLLVIPKVIFSVNWKTKTEELPTPELLCKDETILSFTWETHKPLIYLVETRTTNESEWTFFKKTTCSRILIDKLNPDTSYQIRLWGISSSGDVLGPTNSTWVKTSSSDYTPLPVVQLNSTLEQDGENFTAELEWIPAEDRSCFYKIDRNFADEFHYGSINIKDLFRYKIPNLKIEDLHKIGIQSISGDLKRHSDTVWISIRTPTCLETFNNLTMCVPPPPEDLQVKEVQLDFKKPSFNIEVSWKKPNLIPDYYGINVFSSNFSLVTKVRGTKTLVSFNNFNFTGRYFVKVSSWSAAGRSTPILKTREVNFTDVYPPFKTLESHPVYIPFIVGSVAGFLGLGLIVLFVFLYRRLKTKKLIGEHEGMVCRFEAKCQESLKNLAKENNPLKILNDEWRLQSEKVTVDVLLGEGAFGVVHRGFLKRDEGGELEVAIKTLKGKPSTEEIRQFAHEIEIMKCVGSHPHLVSLVGCCSKCEYLSPLLVVEYCAKGDLQTYLRGAWEQISRRIPEMRFADICSSPEVKNCLSNQVYELFGDTLLEPKDLLSFARQIAAGMEYLSNLKIVHRDLAARNVLVCENRTVKVADFGLSRDVYQENIYTKTGAGKLPIKWMALESLSRQQYTTQSDVWSFGIVLWEIVTLGGTPYSTISIRDLLDLLKSGYRMECPRNCSREFYDIMNMCWKATPKDRPRFSDLKKILEKLLENEERYLSLEMQF